MAAPVVLTPFTTILDRPFLIRKATFTAGADATAFTHGGPAAIPDMAWTVGNTANPTASETAIYSLTTTQFTLDCEAAAGTVTVYLVWFPQGAGGLTAPY